MKQYMFQLLKKKQENFSPFFCLHSAAVRITPNPVIIEDHVPSCFALKISAISESERIFLNIPYWDLVFCPQWVSVCHKI